MKRGFGLGLSLLFIVLAIGFVFVWEFYAKEKIDSVEVVVAKETIKFKEKITEENIEVIHIRRGTEVENHLTPSRYDALIGKHASIKIEKGVQLYRDLIDTYDLVPDSAKGEFVAPIPKEWLFAVPGSLRRTYVADIYVIGDKEQAVMQSLLKDAESEEGGKASEEDEKKSEEVIKTNVKPSSLPILENVRVASVKDSANKEVIESEETKEATGQVAALEIIADDVMLEKVKEYTEQGYKLFIVYKFERGSDSDE